MRTLRVPLTNDDILRLQAGMRNPNNIFEKIESLAHTAMQAGLCALEDINFDVAEAVRSGARESIPQSEHKARQLEYTDKAAGVAIEIKDTSLLAMAAKAAFASGLTVPELAKAAFVSKLQQFRQTGEMTFGPGRES